jgi:broad specificity phosphatase PhoE
METMRESWTDARLDDFRAETARRFDSVERRMENGFDRVDARFDALQRTMILFCGGIIAALLGLIATQL